MKEFEIWHSGYYCTGNDSKAWLVAKVEAETFQEACDIYYKDCNTYDSERLTDWACKLYDNEADARRIFG